MRTLNEDRPDPDGEERVVVTIVSRQKHLWVIPAEGAAVDMVASPRLSAVLISLNDQGGSARPMELKAAEIPKAPHYRRLGRLEKLGLVTVKKLGGPGKGQPVSVHITPDGTKAAEALANRVATV